PRHISIQSLNRNSGRWHRKGSPSTQRGVLLVDTRTFASPPHPDDATELLAALSVHAVVFAFTTSSYLLGAEGEQALKVRLEKRSNGIPVLLPCTAAVAAFRALGVRRIALIHPPWFADDVNQLGIAYFRA